ncbi:hypothetical protein OF83DRAFT_1139042 [Amylostereum chailletii]|nr:hypothetical protein OF83DRAFT_1139042 [Amylostereum chailletii]
MPPDGPIPTVTRHVNPFSRAFIDLAPIPPSARAPARPRSNPSTAQTRVVGAHHDPSSPNGRLPRRMYSPPALALNASAHSEQSTPAISSDRLPLAPSVSPRHARRTRFPAEDRALESTSPAPPPDVKRLPTIVLAAPSHRLAPIRENRHRNDLLIQVAMCAMLRPNDKTPKRTFAHRKQP